MPCPSKSFCLGCWTGKSMFATARELGMPKQTVKTIGFWLHYYQTTGIFSDLIHHQLNRSGMS